MSTPGKRGLSHSHRDLCSVSRSCAGAPSSYGVKFVKIVGLRRSQVHEKAPLPMTLVNSSIVHVPHLELGAVQQVASLPHLEPVEQTGADPDPTIAFARASPVGEAGAHRAM